LREELELIDEVYPKFDRQDYLDGKLQPVFFWFCIETILESENYWIVLFKLPSPRPKDSETRLVDPKEEKCRFVLKSTPIWIQNTETVWPL
jgi:peptide chain release factor 3